MTKTPNEILSVAEQQAALAPETHNSEQSDYLSQAQRIAAQAKQHRHAKPGGTESTKVAQDTPDNIGGSETDLIDQMREMEQSGKIDNGAFAGEPDHDDNDNTYKNK
jgi:hypothetical protein